MISLRDLVSTYGHRWNVSAGSGGGFYAVRIGSLSQQAQDRGLSLVVCGETVTELSHRLKQQTQLEATRFSILPTQPDHRGEP